MIFSAVDGLARHGHVVQAVGEKCEASAASAECCHIQAIDQFYLKHM